MFGPDIYTQEAFWDLGQLALWSPDFLLWFSIERPDSRVRAGQGPRNVSWVCKDWLLQHFLKKFYCYIFCRKNIRGTAQVGCLQTFYFLYSEHVPRRSPLIITRRRWKLKKKQNVGPSLMKNSFLLTEPGGWNMGLCHLKRLSYCLGKKK